MKVHIAEGEVLEIVYKAELRELVYRNQKMGEVKVEISKYPIFKNKEVYFFLKMKQENTKVKILWLYQRLIIKLVSKHYHFFVISYRMESALLLFMTLMALSNYW